MQRCDYHAGIKGLGVKDIIAHTVNDRNSVDIINLLKYMRMRTDDQVGSGIGNLFMCLAGGVIFAAGIGVGSNVVLKKTSLV